MGRILADGIKNVEHLAVFDDMAAQRFGAIDLTPILINILDTVPAAALPYLAEQFDVLGIKGYSLADTEDKKRDLIKKAIELHRYKGTVYAIEESLKTIGINNVDIQENLSVFFYNASYSYDGTINYGAGSWATFRVVLDITEFASVTPTVLNAIRALINVYKNVRSHLIDLTFKIAFEEIMEPIEVFIDNNFDVEDQIGNGNYYNASRSYNSSGVYENTQDAFAISIL